MQGESMTPAEIIRKARRTLKEKVMEAAMEFCESTGAALFGIEVEFEDTTGNGTPPSSQLKAVRVRDEI